MCTFALSSALDIIMHHFYSPDITQPFVTLSNEESEHCVRVMRHREGDVVRVTDGRGHLAEAVVAEAHPKKCLLEIRETITDNILTHNGLHLAVAPTKNADRMEWLLEKAIEIGICSLTFLQCDHSERTHLNLDRLQRLSIAALKQSQTTWLPPLKMMKFTEFIQQNTDTQADKFIAWCDENNQRQLVDMPHNHSEMILLIGPEGDFSREEITQARQSGYTEVKLGNRRLRTETAGLYGCLAAAMRANTPDLVSNNH
ncbi:MAG: 16S rRNA (uracil(1498)-N(3))-methyltransferase [Bacteroidales bacterium]|nr:16S rRNA (uracil(1498)-N(3))-methyltransferase [Bacteroidales bacterium]